jgi:hypothetical protein
MGTSTRTCLVIALGAVLGATLIAVSSAAASTTRTTRYFTISPGRATPSSPARFLRPGFGPVVTLASYTPGDLSLQWTLAPNREWPASATETGSQGWFYEFEHGRVPGRIPAAKFINRARGTCLMLRWHGNGSRVTAARCDRAGTALSGQIWAGDPVQGAGTYRYFWQRKANLKRCLDVTDFRDAIGTPLQGWSCQPSGHPDGVSVRPSPWNQRFHLAPVAQATCEIIISSHICGLPVTPP